MASETGLSRRDLMKKGAAAGAIVWSAPILTSTPAFASTGCSGSKPCETFYYAKFEGGGCTGGSGDSENTGCRRPGKSGTPLADALCGEAEPSIADGCSLLKINGQHQSYFTGSFAHLVFPNDLAPILVQLKAANECYTYKVEGSTLTLIEVTASVGGDKGGKKEIVTVTNPPCTIGTYDVDKSGTTTVIDINWPCGSLSHVGTYFCA